MIKKLKRPFYEDIFQNIYNDHHCAYDLSVCSTGEPETGRIPVW
jgi:hypothetical protein